MNQQKVEQAFRQILDKCGEGIVRDRNRFKSAVFDLLDSIQCADERLVLKHAMDSDSFWILLGTSPLTADNVQKAIEQIQKESRMTKEDAEFIVQCVAAVRDMAQDTAVTEEPVQEPVVPQEEDPVVPQEEPVQEPETPVPIVEEPVIVEHDTPNRKKKSKKIIGVAVAAVCLIAVVVSVLSFHSTPSSSGKQATEDFETYEKAGNDTEKMLTNIGEENKTAVMMKDSWRSLYTHFNINRDDIITVTFINTLDSVSDNMLDLLNTLDSVSDNMLDLSEEKDSSVIAWSVRENEYEHLFIGSEGKIVLEDCRAMFSDWGNVQKIEFNNCIDTSQVTDMSLMFIGCSNLQELDLNSFDTSQVRYMNDMFKGCSSLHEIDLSSFDTSQVGYMSYMFNGCSSLREIDLSSFDTSQVVWMHGMFDGCSSLQELDLSSFDTNRVGTMDYMFNGCSSLQELDLSSFDTSQVRFMNGMFEGCSSLHELDLSSFDIHNTIYTTDMFLNCGVTAEEANLKN